MWNEFRILNVGFWIIALAVLLNSTFNIQHPAFAQTADDLQAKIDQRNKDIQNLQAEIKQYEKQIAALGDQESSLAATLKSLDLTQKKLQADILVTTDKIDAKALQIQQLSRQITGKQNDISDDHRVIAGSFKAMNEVGNQSLMEILLSSASISEALGSLDNLSAIQESVSNRIKSLQQDEATLTNNKKATEKAKADLVTLNNNLLNQKKVVLATAAEKNAILKETKQSEATYKQQLAERKQREAELEQEILDYESQLHLTVDLSKLPHTGSGVLSYPIEPAVVTQYFGNTPFATANPQIYNGKGHTGVDFKASIGTPIKAALSGTVVGMFDTDSVPGCYSFGRWIMVRHDDGLSTLYAHLSVQSVSVGEHVETGQVIGYSGNTGYTTGPHLHFGVYATQGVEIKKFDTSVNCHDAIIPVADFKAYLNPLSYL